MPVLHDKFALEYSAIWDTRTCHANSAKGQWVDWVFCMTNEGEGELCTVI